MSQDVSRWRSSSSYDYLDGLTAPDLAWEWLRRNDDYQRDYAEIEQYRGDNGPLIEMARQRWRLHCPRQAKPECRRDVRLLVA